MAVTQLLEHLMDTLEGIRMPTRFIHLDRMPRDEEGVAELHQALQPTFPIWLKNPKVIRSFFLIRCLFLHRWPSRWL